MKSPNWQEAREFVDRIAGSSDPAMTFQVFDDKAEDFEIAAWKHGKLTDPEIRKFLISKANEGCGIFVTISACDGKGRRRQNVTHARAAFIDMDGEPLPDVWPIQPDIQVESSPGKFHAYWLLQTEDDLNDFSDCQARLAKFFGGDPKVFDPPRVMRLPGFYHQKSATPFRSRIIEKCSMDVAQFDRRTLEELASKHPCDYAKPAERKEGGRSEEPASGWDNEADIVKARYYLKTCKTPATGDRNNAGYRVAAVLNDLGISPELSRDLMLEIWNDRLDDPLPPGEIAHVTNSAPRYKASSAGSASGPAPEDEFPDDLIEITEENGEFNFEAPAGKALFTFEGPDALDIPEEFPKVPDRAEADQFDFETGLAPGEAVKARPKTVKRLTGGLSWSYGSEVKAEPLTWLWPHRVPRGKLTIIAGFPDQGKSQIMLAIAAAVTKGAPWPNGEGVAPEGVAIILSSEDDESDTLIPRLAAAGAKLSNIIIVRAMVTEVTEGKKTRRVLNIEDDLRNLQAIMKQVHDSGRRVRMIGLDPINAYFGGARKGDSHKNSDMRALLTPITEWAATLKVAIVAISHFNKGGNSHALYRVTDSGAITAAARSVYFALKKHNDDPKDAVERIFISGKHNLASDAIKGLSYTITARDVSDETGVPNQVMPYVEFGGEDDTSVDDAMGASAPKGRKPVTREAAREFILELFDEAENGGPLLRDDVIAEAKLAGHSATTINRACEDLGVKSRKAKEFQGKYWLHAPDPAADFTDDDIPGPDPEDVDAEDHDQPDFG